jgi:hypothetical protein
MVGCGNFNGNSVIPNQRFTVSLTYLPEVILALCAFGSLCAASRSLLSLIVKF